MTDKNGPGATAAAAGDTTENPGYRPLYKQVRDIITRRLAEGEWLPGAMLPSEQELARSLAVSQGTVRKALDAMAAENLIERRQGRGTFVSRQDDERVLFHFFRLQGDDGSHVFPESDVLGVTVDMPEEDEARILGISGTDGIIRIRRTRSLGGRPVIVETLTLPAARFPGLDERDSLPNNLYVLFANEYGVSIARASERLKAVAADAHSAEILELAPGAPLLAIERVAYSIAGEPVEWRVSLCRTDMLSYASELR